MEIAQRLKEFKADLMSMDSNQVFRKYFIEQPCFALDSEKQRALKTKISEMFNVNYTDVYIMGSAKLGFSIAAKKRYRAFGDYSDIDIAIISPHIFESYWKENVLYLYENPLIGYEIKNSFSKYVAQRGWIRPDFFVSPELKNNWTEKFRVITASQQYGPYKITAGIYYDFMFLEKYQLQCIEQCKGELKNGN